MSKMPVNMNAHVYYNVVKPDGMGDWQTRFQIAFMFPAKSMKEKMKTQNYEQLKKWDAIKEAAKESK